MKKVLFIIALIFVGLFVIGCAQEAADLRWNNATTDSAQDIKWVSYDDEPDVEWNETLSSEGEKTAFKEVTGLNGNGECNLGGAAGEIEYDLYQNRNYQLSAGSSETLDIFAVSAK